MVYLGSKNKKHLRGSTCDPHTASSVFRILLLMYLVNYFVIKFTSGFFLVYLKYTKN